MVEPHDIEVELKKIDEQIGELVKNDDILSGLEESSEERIEQLIDAETGRKIRVFVTRQDGKRLDVVVSPDASVLQLRNAVELAAVDYLVRSGISSSLKPMISWKKFWLQHSLVAHDVAIDEVTCSIREYNITSGTVLSFSKRFRRRATVTAGSIRDSATNRPSTSSRQAHRLGAYDSCLAKGVRSTRK